MMGEPVEKRGGHLGITNDFMMPVSSIVYYVERERAECRSGPASSRF
ncbi:hypothetical protein J2046_006208, partial [Rhizobium petrolearium]|nr:hypothetical protein [Neorhizobium petrolearium]